MSNPFYTRQHTFMNGITADGGEVEDEFVALDTAFAAAAAAIAALGLGTLVQEPEAGDENLPLFVNQDATGFTILSAAEADTALRNILDLGDLADEDNVPAALMLASQGFVVFGKFTANAGPGEETAIGAAGITFLAAATSVDQRAALGLGDVAVLNSIAAANLASGSAIPFGAGISEESTYRTLSGGTPIPIDNSIPLISEGHEILNHVSFVFFGLVRVTVKVPICIQTSGAVAAMAIFTGDGVCLGAINKKAVAANQNDILIFDEIVNVAFPTVSLSVRASASSGNLYVCGNESGALFGGAMKASIVTERIR